MVSRGSATADAGEAFPDKGCVSDPGSGPVYQLEFRQLELRRQCQDLFHNPELQAHVQLQLATGNDLAVSGVCGRFSWCVGRRGACSAAARLGNPSLETLGVVTRAIFQRQPLIIRYESLSGASERVIVPHVLVDNGLRWHVRGFDRKTQEFRDFVVTRIIEPRILDNDVPLDYETRESDNQWNHQVTLEMVHHPDQPRPEVTHLDYEMQEGVLRMAVQALTAGYTLRQWSVDCSPDHSLRGPEYRLWLRNHEVLVGVDNALLAPGFSESTEV